MDNLWRWIRNQVDRSVAVACTVIGLVAIYLGWLGVSSHALPSQQIAYLASGAVLGIFALGVAATLWLSADLKDEWRKLDVIATELRTANERPVAEHGRATTEGVAES